MSFVQDTENLQWKCPGCYHINDIEQLKCGNTDCDNDIPKDYKQFIKINEQKNENENKQEETEIENQKQLIKDKLSQLNKTGNTQQNQDLGKELSDKIKDSLNINSEESLLKEKNISQNNKQDIFGQNQENSEIKEQKEEQKNVIDSDKSSSENENEKDKQNNIQENQTEKDLDKALGKKDEGAQYFKQGHWKLAIEEYEDAVDFCPENESKTLSVLYSNLGICNIKLELWDQAVEHCSKSISLDSEYRKPYLNRAIAYEKSEREEEALEDLKAVFKMNPTDKQLQLQIFRLEKKVKEVQEKRKTEVLSGLKDIGNSLLGKFGMSLDNFKLQQTDNGGYTVNFNK